MKQFRTVIPCNPHMQFPIKRISLRLGVICVILCKACVIGQGHSTASLLETRTFGFIFVL